MNILARLGVLLTLVVFAPTVSSGHGSPYFSFGEGVVLEYNGTYEFSQKRTAFAKSGLTTYVIRSSGDQSPSEDTLINRSGYTYWMLGHSGEQWLKFKNAFRTGDHWSHRLRGWNQTYRVVSSDVTVNVPAGEFKHCAKITITWIAHDHDMSGPQRIDLYLAPGLGIIKRTVYSMGAVEHEEVATSYSRLAGNDK